jgi:hypothetical protein
MMGERNGPAAVRDVALPLVFRWWQTTRARPTIATTVPAGEGAAAG